MLFDPEEMIYEAVRFSAPGLFYRRNSASRTRRCASNDPLMAVTLFLREQEQSTGGYEPGIGGVKEFPFGSTQSEAVENLNPVHGLIGEAPTVGLQLALEM
jgi:hypothetical protein